MPDREPLGQLILTTINCSKLLQTHALILPTSAFQSLLRRSEIFKIYSIVHKRQRGVQIGKNKRNKLVKMTRVTC